MGWFWNKKGKKEKKDTNPNEQKYRQAEIYENDGAYLEAAQLYDELGDYEKSFQLYLEIGKFNSAADVYSKTNQPNLSRLAKLYEKANRLDEAIKTYYLSGSIDDLQWAYFLARDNGYLFHEKRIKDKIENFEKEGAERVRQLLEKISLKVVGRYSDCLGIDFGTTNSVGAVFNIESKEIEIVTNEEYIEEVFLPSYFAIDENNKPLYGEKARIKSWTVPQNALARVKRSMGKSVVFDIARKTYKPEQVAAMIIHMIKQSAEEYIRNVIFKELQIEIKERSIFCSEERIHHIFSSYQTGIRFDNVVLTVPAFYNDNQKRATRDAAEVAGLKVKRLVHEPTAACLSYGYSEKIEGEIVVIDFGGGTLDISLVDIGDGVYEVQAINGDIELGGSDIDSLILEYVKKQLSTKYDEEIVEKLQNEQWNRLRNTCEQLKISLSQKETDTITLYNFIGNDSYEVSLNRLELEEIAVPVLSRLKERLLEFVQDNPKMNIDGVILVGNATKMPAVKHVIENVFSAKVLDYKDVGTVVAAGAAIQGAILNGLVDETLLIDVVPYSLGLAVVNKNADDGEDEIIKKIITKNSAIPITKTDTYTTNKDNQSNVWLRIFQGESSKVEETYPLGAFVLDEIESAPKGTPQIEVTFNIGTDCILTVTAMNKSTGKEQNIRIEGAVNLSVNEKNQLSMFFEKWEKINEEEAQYSILSNTFFWECKRTLEIIERTNLTISEFEDLFHDTIESNASAYHITQEQMKELQLVFLNKSNVHDKIKQYERQIGMIQKSFEEISCLQLDYADETVIQNIQQRNNVLNQVMNQLKELQKQIEGLQQISLDWLQLLDGMELDYNSVRPELIVNSYIRRGNFNAAEKFLNTEVDSKDISPELFYMYLKIYRKTGNKKKYVEIHNKYGYLFDYKYPDFAHLDHYLAEIKSSVVMLISEEERTTVSGSGFAIMDNMIITNKHVVEGRKKESFRIIGKNVVATIVSWKLDSSNDLAILYVDKKFVPFRLGDSAFVKPGSRVIAIGFPNIESDIFEDNIFISQGQVNTIKKVDGCNDRVFCVDAKLNHGISGGPLINELGEVVGINTMRVSYNQDDHYNIALPISVINKYVKDGLN